MNPSFRQLDTADYEWCVSILEDGFEKRPDLRAALPAVWNKLQVQDAIFMAAVEDRDANRLIAFGATVFVSDSFLEEAICKPEPHLALRLLEREVIGRRRMILRPDQIRKATRSEGLNLVILHYSEVLSGCSEDERGIVRDTMVYGFLETHRRHSLRSLLYEFYGEEDERFVLESGANLISDFAEWYKAHHQPLPDPEHHPFLVGLDRATAGKKRAAWMSWLFLSPATRVGLSPSEQKIAARALAGETDAELTENPAISASTIRKHWRSIYKKFEAAGIDLLAPETLAGKYRRFTNGSTAHKKKRPFLLNYLRQHPEELRPQAGKDRTLS